MKPSKDVEKPTKETEASTSAEASTNSLPESTGKEQERELDSEDIVLLDSFIGEETRKSVVRMYEKALQRPDANSASFGSVASQPIAEKGLRTRIHQVNILLNATLQKYCVELIIELGSSTNF